MLAGHEAIAAALEPRKRSMGWVVGPTYELAEKVYREITMIAAEHLRHRIVTLRENDKKLVIRNMGGGLSEIRAKSADNPISLLGEALDFCILDEASRLKPTIWDSFISQRLIDREGWVLAISTPRGQNWFYDMWRRGEQGDPDYECWNFPSWNNPYLRKELIDAERERLPARVFSQEYEARWVQGAGAVFVGVRECANSEWQEPVAGEQYWAGLDLARVADWTVLTIINERMEVVHCERYNRIAWALQVERIKGTLDRYNQCPVMMDSTGVGDPILEELREAGCWVRPYGFTSRSKAQIIDGLALAIEKGEIALPRPDVTAPALPLPTGRLRRTRDDGDRLRSNSG